MKRIISVIIFIFCFVGFTYCGQQSRIELNDGSIIEAEIVSVKNGIYTLDNASLGRIKIGVEKIRKIENLNQKTIPKNNLPEIPDADALKTQIDQARQKIMTDPGIMQIVNSLATDPQFQEAMKDPWILNAVKSQDIKGLMQNEKFVRLINNAKVKEIKDKLQEENQ